MTHNQEGQERGYTNSELLQLFKRRSYLIMVFLFLSLGLCLIGTSILHPPLYTATSLIHVNSEHVRGELYEYNELYRTLKICDTCQRAFTSDKVLLRVIEELNEGTTTRELANRISVISGREADSILLQVRHEVPRVAAAIADMIISRALEGVALSLEGITVASTERAAVSTTSERRLPLLPFVFALLAGLVLGGALILFSCALHPKMLSSKEIPQLFGIPLITSIPRIRKREVRSLRNQKGACGQTVLDFLEANRMLALHLHHHSSLHQGRRILVTSTLPKEGKTSVALNTGISLSLQGKRVIIIDCDQTREAENSFCPGVLSSAPGELSEEPAGLEELIIEDQERKVALLDSRRLGTRFANRNDFCGLLDRLERVYDVIIIDGPSMEFLEQVHPLSVCVDGVLFVIREDRGTTWEIRQAITTLKRISLAPIAAVYNGCSLSGDPYSRTVPPHNPQTGRRKERSSYSPIQGFSPLFRTIAAWTLAVLVSLLIGFTAIHEKNPAGPAGLRSPAEPQPGSSSVVEEHAAGLQEAAPPNAWAEGLSLAEILKPLALDLLLFALLSIVLYYAWGSTGCPHGMRSLLTIGLSGGAAVGRELLIIGGDLLLGVIPALMGIALGMSVCVLSGCFRTFGLSAEGPVEGAADQKRRELQLIRTIHPISEDVL